MKPPTVRAQKAAAGPGIIIASMTDARRATLGLFGGVALVYLSLSPFTYARMGYALEEEAACRQILSGTTVHWPRHGAVGLLFQCPFIGLGRAVAGPSEWFEDRALSLQPILASALLVALTFAWCRRISGSATQSYVLALAMAFCTMIWPYAYIGLETTQSLFLLGAGFLALASEAPPSWPRTLAVASCAAVAVSTKSNGAMLVPAVVYLVAAFLRERHGAAVARRMTKGIAIGLIVTGTYVANALIRTLFWRPYGGLAANVNGYRAHGVVDPMLHLVGFLGSPNKGLIVFAPLALLALFAIPRALGVDRRATIFAMLAFAGLAGGSSLLDLWTDETWGPRYLHSSIAPLVLCLAAAWPSTDAAPRSRAPFYAAVALGFGVSLLGVLFHYGTVARAAVEAAPVDHEALQGNPVWNHVRFNSRLFAVWLALCAGNAPDPVLFAQGHPWDFREPVRVAERKPVDLRTYAVPQPLVLKALGPGSAVRPAVVPMCAGLLLGGVFLLRRTWRRLTPEIA